MKRIVNICLMILICIMMSSRVHGATIKINKRSLTLYEEKTATLKITGTKKKVTWASADEAVATVSAKGVVKGVATGETDITATVAGKTCVCHIKVIEEATLSNKTMKLRVGKTHQLTLDHASAKVTWKTSKKKIATVTSNGLVKAIKKGTATITATHAGYKHTCKITVHSGPAISAKSLTVYKDQTATLKVTNANSVTWSVDDESIATISQSGTVTGLKPGITTVSALTDDDEILTCKVTVALKPYLNETSLTLTKGKTFDLTLANATSKVTWKSANKKIATVTSGGVVKGVKSGTTTITATMSQKTYKCKVTVKSVNTNTLTSLLGSKTRIIAHRGYSAKYPENTVPAYEAAGKESTYWGIETDLQDTKDGVLVCMHNETIDKMMDGTGDVASHTYKELKAMHINGGNNINLYDNLTIATFEEYLAICKKYDKVAIVEVKKLSNTSLLKKVVATIKSYGMRDKCILTSFQTSYLTTIRNQYDSTIPIMPVYKTALTSTIYNSWSSYNNCAISVKYTFASKSLVKKYNDINIKFAVWTLTTKSDVNQMKDYGVHMIFCNEPMN